MQPTGEGRARVKHLHCRHAAMMDLLRVRVEIMCCSFKSLHYLSISVAQFRMTDKGAAFGSSTLVLIRNFWPSAATS